MKIKTILYFIILFVGIEISIRSKFDYFDLGSSLITILSVIFVIIFFVKKKNNNVFIKFLFVTSFIMLWGVNYFSYEIADKIDKYNLSVLEEATNPLNASGHSSVFVFYGMIPERYVINIDNMRCVNSLGGATYEYSETYNKWYYTPF